MSESRSIRSMGEFGGPKQLLQYLKSDIDGTSSQQSVRTGIEVSSDRCEMTSRLYSPGMEPIPLESWIQLPNTANWLKIGGNIKFNRIEYLLAEESKATQQLPHFPDIRKDR
ncbi:hypothetical protein FGO68_gene13301 [Halteria grandinella]|uniref:Uncharacterized protein n=1 Tax=Halteria grandinella TaxID=5974 RepID=A0A8J8NAT5_HALGN|nr:hypothetical protein FGO68_gene13301 [Halteria grandinella]